MGYVLRKRNRTLIIQVSGDLDLVKVTEFRETVDSTMQEMIAENLIIDLSGVNFIDSSGLGVILGRFRKISAQGGKLVLIALTPNIKRILELSGILSFIPYFDDEQKAWKFIEKQVI